MYTYSIMKSTLLILLHVFILLYFTLAPVTSIANNDYCSHCSTKKITIEEQHDCCSQQSSIPKEKKSAENTPHDCNKCTHCTSQGTHFSIAALLYPSVFKNNIYMDKERKTSRYSSTYQRLFDADIWQPPKLVS